MIDISDGLISDLRHIMEQSRVGAEIYINNLPINRPTENTAKFFHESVSKYALSGGEDYELLFTIPEKNLKKCQNIFKKYNLAPLHIIGRVTDKKSKLIMKKPGGIFLHYQPVREQ